ncbi:Similar to hypothetical protein [Tuber melanosporum Mel28]; acc. no. XP_002840700 [Pyronema omphalodes CBS 100304]|uniref:Uncharacterized protein n=1 Tax=Pyronema omphalodes (strain CBS 100304) TaxID=1076935 RepID=U4KWU4_PYROM|nr:Similar to hypothetical protein [Tuber melanosporum Mel28]; acc. no. XP_002840700 [Pyronema omphalodes CBS 100304]
MANAVAVATGHDDFGARLQKLNLPVKPYLMDNVEKLCDRHRDYSVCFCYEYTTMLDRPDYSYKYLQDSPEPEVRTPKSTNGTVTAKKKFTLGDYSKGKIVSTPKSEQKSSEPSPSNANNAPARNGLPPIPPPSTVKLEPKTSTSHTSTPAASKTSKETPTNSARSTKAPVPAKRTADNPVESMKPSPKMSTAEVSRSNKRPRLSSPPPTTHKLPPPPARRHLSPLPSRRSPPPRSRTPPRRSPPRSAPTPPRLVLPPMLSPTLPKIIEDALAAAEEFDDEVSSNKPSRYRETSNGVGRKRSESIKKPSSTSSHPLASPGRTLPKKPQAALTASKTSGKRPFSPTDTKSTMASKYPTPKQESCIVKWRIKKKNDLQLLLKMKPCPTAAYIPPTAKHKATTGTMTASKGKQPANRSPAFKSPVTKREHEAVTPPPKKSSLADKKYELTNGDVITPSLGRDARNGTHSTTNGTTDTSELYTEGERFSAIGKALKHEGEQILKRIEHDHQDNAKELKKALCLLVDSCMCFCLAFSVHDRIRLIEGKTARTGHWSTWPALSGFVSDRAKIRQHDYERELVNTIKWLPPDHNATKEERNQYMGVKNQLRVSHERLKFAWHEGMKYLNVEDMKDKFKLSFGGRTTKWIEPQQPPKTIGKYKQPYQLPFHRYTTPLEAINFGRKFLEEWAEKNGLVYTSRLKELLV